MAQQTEPVTTTEDLAFAPASAQAELVRSGEVSPTELVELYLRRIERLDPRLNAFRVVLAERALAEAEQAEDRRAAGEERPLLGVPIAIKDNMDLAGELTCHGTGAFPDQPASQDSEVVRRLRAAGAIVIGKTHLPELAIHGFTESATWGVTRNPWNLNRSSGGSSGGSAAATAAGLCAVASASDGGGSIRIPAASCGIFGLKPQRGRIPLLPDLEHWRGMSVFGCVSRAVLDTAVYLDVTAGGSSEPDAPTPPERPFVESARTPPGTLRIAWTTNPSRAVAPPFVGEAAKGAVTETAQLLATLGHQVFERAPEWGTLANSISPRYLRGIADDVEMVPHPDRLERRTRGYRRLGSLYPRSVIEKACGEWRDRDRQRVNAIFESCDVLMTPVMGGPAVEIGRWEGRGALWSLLGESRYYPFTATWNHLGNPAAAVPAGFDGDGLPLSVMLVGRPNDEATLLSLAAQLEAERPLLDRRPPLD